MTPAEVALNTPRAMLQLEPDRVRYKGLPSECVLIERNLQYSFKRHKDDKGVYWVHFPEKKSNLTARVYPDLRRRIVRIAVFQQDWRDPDDTTKGRRIVSWTVDLPMTGDHWTEQLSKWSGRAITQSEKQPKCFCQKFLILRQRTSDGRQFFGCSRFPNCTQTATIGDYEVVMNRPYCFMKPHITSSKD